MTDRLTGRRQRRRPRRATSLVLAAWLAVACSSPDATSWADITPSSGAVDYEGSVEAPLDDRLASRLRERDLQIVDSRVEYLPAGVDWQEHLADRDDHVGDLARVDDRIPEPDAPVLVAEYDGDGMTLFVIGRADDARERLVVLTALAE